MTASYCMQVCKCLGSVNEWMGNCWQQHGRSTDCKQMRVAQNCQGKGVTISPRVAPGGHTAGIPDIIKLQPQQEYDWTGWDWTGLERRVKNSLYLVQVHAQMSQYVWLLQLQPILPDPAR